MKWYVIVLMVSILLAACASGGGQEAVEMSIQLTSPAFAEGQPIPKAHSCEGGDTSPPLEWTGVPKEAKSLVLICDDPDAPLRTWVHWVLFEVPADSTALPKGVPAREKLDDGIRQGLNDFGRVGYGGPCPPPGKPHRYFFKLYALDASINPGENPRKKDVEKAMEGHILAQGQLMGTYKR